VTSTPRDLRRPSRRGLLRLVGCAPFTPFTLWGCAAPPPFPLDGDLRESLAAVAVHHDVCTAALAVLEGGRVREVAVAGACPSPIAGPREAVFQAASLSKPVFAYAVLGLVAAGRLDLDQPLLPLLPDGYVHAHLPFRRDSASSRVTDPRLARITARMALTHTSGLPNWSLGPLAFEQEPGARWRYSGEGFALLQRVVERLTAAPLHAWMRRELFDPLGMRSSSFVGDERTRGREVAGEGGVSSSMRFDVPVAAASLLTSAGDYATFVAALLADEARLAATLQNPVQVDPSLSIQWGLGWGLHVGADGERHLWHWGNNPGFRSFVMARLDTGDGFVLLTNHRRGIAVARGIAQARHASAVRVFDFSLVR
jgi:CubicO group peptidase (beta-lactamase class C family)